jgi:phosphoglycolate phosphatase
MFDIDSTLLTTGHVTSVFDRCFQLATGQILERKLKLAAMPELLIMQQLVDCCEPGSAVDIPTLKKLYEQELQRMLAVAPPVVLGGARELLAAVAGSGTDVLFATGNSRRIAELKLEVAGLAGVLQARGVAIQGAFGDHLRSKSEIVGCALDAWVQGSGRAPDTAAIVGDSADDMAAGRSRGMRCVGVCTGASSREELLRAGASCVFETLADTRAVMSALQGDSPHREHRQQC